MKYVIMPVTTGAIAIVTEVLKETAGSHTGNTFNRLTIKRQLCLEHHT
jgi:hypothetical protein